MKEGIGDEVRSLRTSEESYFLCMYVCAHKQTCVHLYVLSEMVQCCARIGPQQNELGESFLIWL